jgi:hypothetical protein
MAATYPRWSGDEIDATLSAMILALRILYFEDLSVGMTEFARAHRAAGSSKSLGSY